MMRFHLPLFHNGLSGIGVLLGPTGGYLVGFVPAALVTGLAYEKNAKWIRISGLCASILIVYACGITWLCWSAGMGVVPALLIGMVPFLPGDPLKIGAAYLIAERFS